MGSGEFRLNEPGKDPAPIHELVEGDVARQEQLGEEDEDDVRPGAGAAQSDSTQFALEQDLQRNLADDLHIIEPGLALFEDEDIKGFEYPPQTDLKKIDEAAKAAKIELSRD